MNVVTSSVESPHEPIAGSSGGIPRGSSASSQGRRFDVVILGGGFGGVWSARALARLRGLRVALIADQNVMLFHPMLAEVCGASLSPLHIVNPIRNLCPCAEVFRGEVLEIDSVAKRVVVRTGVFSAPEVFHYGQLVVALGGVVDLSRVPGMAEHALPMKTVGDAIRLRAAVIDRLEEANLVTDEAERQRLLGFAVVGGGYSGVETVGQITDLLHEVRRLFPWLARTPPRVMLMHSGDFILPQIGEELGRFSEKKLRERGVEIFLNTRVNAVTAAALHLSGRVVEARTIVTTVGNAPHPLVLKLIEKAGLPSDRGRIVVDSTLRVKGRDDIWAVGDCAAVPMVGDAGFAPATAQFALREGTLAGRNIARAHAGRPLRAFDFKGLGELASIGHNNAVAKIFGLKFSGFFAWWLWRTVYLSKLPGLERKLRVMMDWTLDLIFPRDISLLRTDMTPRLGTTHLEVGDRVFSAGDPAVNFYIVKAGRIEVRDATGPIKSLSKGQHFGESDLLASAPRAYDAVAVEPSELLTLPRSMFESLALSSPVINDLLRSSSLQYSSREQVEKLFSRLPDELRGAAVSTRMRRDVVTILEGTPISDVLQLFKRNGYGNFPVVDAGGRVTGVVVRQTFFDVLEGGSFSGKSPLPQGAISPAASIPPEATVDVALRQMVRSGVRKLVVCDAERRILGLLSLVDILVE